MKKYRSLAFICALALMLTGCKSQSVDSNSGSTTTSEITTIDTTEPVTSKIDNPAHGVTSTGVTNATPVYISTDHCLVNSGTLVDPEKIVDVDSDIDQIDLQSYTIGNDHATFTFDAPTGLEFREESTAISDITLFESYAHTDDLTIGAIHLELAYTPGQPQELLDRLGFPGNFYITTECLTETADDGTIYDIILMALYEDEEKQELHSAGMMGCYPTERGVLFFGYEMNSEESYEHYYTAQQQTLDSLVISESDYTEPELPDEELPEAFQTVVCEEQGCSFPVLKEFEYWEDDDATTMWSGMTADNMNLVVAGYEADVYYKDIFKELTFDGYSDSYKVLSSDYISTSDGRKFSFAEMALYSTEGTWDFTCLYAIYEADVGSYIIGYTFMGECDDEKKELIIESFKGFKILN